MQLLTSEATLVSQPLASTPSQSLKPALQRMPHVPLQVGLPFWLLQTVPQPPQLVVDVLLLVSQPVATLPSQSA